MLVDCEAAIASWGSRAKFRRAKLGLTSNRQAGVCLLVQFANEQSKLPIDTDHCQMMPAALRLKQLNKDMFIRNPTDDAKLKLLLRKIRIILEQDKLRSKGKGHVVDQILDELPSCLNMGAPTKVAARIRAVTTRDQNNTSLATPTISSAAKLQQQRQADQRLENLLLKVINIEGPNAIVPCNLWSPLRAQCLQELRLIHCGLSDDIPHQLAECFGSTLLVLDLSHNQLTGVSGQFCAHMRRLSHFNISHNQVHRLPLEIRFVRHLKLLDLSFNQLKTLPTTFTDLTELTELRLSNNRLRLLPAFCEKSVRLQRLDVSHNPLNCATSQEFYHEDEQFFVLNRANTFMRLEHSALLSIARHEATFRMAHCRLAPILYSRLQSQIFKCFSCAQLAVGAAYHLVDILDYIGQVEILETNGNLRQGMSFVKTICYACFVGKNHNHNRPTIGQPNKA